MKPEHGTYQPGYGYFDAARNVWVKSTEQLTPTMDQRPASGYEAERFQARQQQRTFTANPDLEQLRRLRDSGQPEQRETFAKVATGRARMQLADYETRLRDHLAAGGSLPAGVTKPTEEA